MSFIPPRNFTLGDNDEQWMNMNITRDPKKGIFTQYRNKRHEREQYEFEEDYSRYSENIETFARGSDPMKEFQMNNTQGSKQAYKPIINKILRVPQTTEYSLLPLSRLPVENEAYATKKNAPKVESQKLPESSRSVQENGILPNMHTKLSDESVGGNTRKEQFSKQKDILINPFNVSKNDKIKSDYEKIRSLFSDTKIIRKNSNSHSVSSQKQFTKESRDITLTENMIHKNKIEMNQSSAKSSGVRRLFINEDPNRGIGNTLQSSITSSKNRSMDNNLYEKLSNKEVHKTILEPKVPIVKESKANIMANRKIESINFKNFKYNSNTNKSLIQMKKPSEQKNNDNFLVENPISVNESSKKVSVYPKFDLDSFKNQELSSYKIQPKRVETKKNTSFRVIQNNKVDVKTVESLKKDSYQRGGEYIPSKIRDVNVPKNMLREIMTLKI